jgi:hypothetical protein
VNKGVLFRDYRHRSVKDEETSYTDQLSMKKEKLHTQARKG